MQGLHAAVPRTFLAGNPSLPRGRCTLPSAMQARGHDSACDWQAEVSSCTWDPQIAGLRNLGLLQRSGHDLVAIQMFDDDCKTHGCGDMAWRLQEVLGWYWLLPVGV